WVHPRIRVGVRALSGVRLSLSERLEHDVHEPRHLTKALPALERLADGDRRATTAQPSGQHIEGVPGSHVAGAEHGRRFPLERRQTGDTFPDAERRTDPGHDRAL